jgi:hypothetical protein
MSAFSLADFLSNPSACGSIQTLCGLQGGVDRRSMMGQSNTGEPGANKL